LNGKDDVAERFFQSFMPTRELEIGRSQKLLEIKMGKWRMKDTMPDFFSIIIPCYNAADVIAFCLNSIVESNFQNYEVICVDDCSRDNTAAIIQQYENVTLIRLDQNQGAAVARNIGAKQARGNILLFIDSDVIIMNDTMAKIQSTFTQKKADVVVGIYAAQHPFEGIASNYKNLHLRYTRMIMEEEVHIFDGSCVAIQKEVFDRVSGFDENIKILAGEDWDLANRISETGYRIILDKSIPFIHRKYYTVSNLFQTDLRKAFGVIKLMLRTSKRKKGLIAKKTAGSLPPSMAFSLFFAFLFAPFLLALFINPGVALGGFFLVFFSIYLCNRSYFHYLSGEKNRAFMLASLGIFFIYQWALIIGFTAGIFDYILLKHKY
jgi:glycosyltransferase involved in cell wall biosynthesis